MRAQVRRRSALVHGNRIAYLEAGDPTSPPVVLVHGLLSDSGTWSADLVPLARAGMRAIAVDLVGHGASDKPAGSYLLDDFAQMLAGLLDVLELPRATVCGHSLGGAIAVHFGYHYPDRLAALVLVSAGGLGREVNAVLRLLSLPLAEQLTAAVLGRRPVQWLLRRALVHRLFRVTPDRLVNLRRIGRTLFRSDARAAFFRSLRGVIGPRGQRGSFLEMRYLAEQVPTLLVWSEHDVIIPVTHAQRAHEHLPGSRLVVFPGGGHEPHRHNAEQFASCVASLVLTR